MLLLLILLFNSVCFPAFSDIQCVLPLSLTRENSSNSGDCQYAAAGATPNVRSECEDSEPTYIGSLGQCENIHGPISECNFTMRFFGGELQCGNDQLFIEVDNISGIMQPDFASRCHLNISCNSVQHCLEFEVNATLKDSHGSGSGSGVAPSFCPAALMSKAALAMLTSPPTSTIVTMRGTHGSPTGDSNTGSGMGSAGTSDRRYIALGGGIAGGILSLVILFLLIIVCCLATKIIRNERRVRLKLSKEGQPEKATHTATDNSDSDMYDTVDDEQTNADKQSTSLSHGSSHGNEDISGNYTYISSNSCKKRPTVREATCSLCTTGEYSEIPEEQQTSQLYESIDRPKMAQPNPQPSPQHLTTPRVAILPATNNEYSHRQHTKFTNRAPERLSMPLPLPPEEHSRLDARSQASVARHSNCCSIELGILELHADSQPQTTSQQVENEYSLLEEPSPSCEDDDSPPLPPPFHPELELHADSQPQTTSQQVEVFENEYSLLEEPSPSCEDDDSPPLPPPFHPELCRLDSNNEEGIYSEIASVQNVQLGEGNHSCQEPPYDSAIPWIRRHFTIT